MSDAPMEMTMSAFVAWEAAQPVRHEFHRGRVRRVDNGRRVHGRVVGNLVAALGNRLEGSRCQVFATSMAVLVGDEAVLFPDVVVTGDQADLRADAALLSPSLVLEVLSPASAAWDWSEKFALYRRLPALQEYVLLDPDTRRAEAFRRTAGGGWTFHDMSDDGVLVLPVLDVCVPLEEVFGGV